MRLRLRNVVAALRIDDQVEIALAIAELDIGEAVIFFRQRPQCLGEHRDRDGVDRQFAARGAPHVALDPDQIADVEQPHRGEVGDAQKVAMAENLDLARGIVQIDEHAAVADRADPPSYPHALAGFRTGREVGMPGLDLGSFVAARERIGIGIDAEFLETVELGEPGSAQRFLLVPAGLLVVLHRTFLRVFAHPAAASEGSLNGLCARSSTTSCSRRKLLRWPTLTMVGRHGASRNSR